MKTTTTAALMLTLLAAPAIAQQQVDETFPTSSSGELEVVNTSGSVTVEGWNRGEIRVTGTLGRGTERLEIDRGAESPEIRVVLPRNARNVGDTDLRVALPTGKSVLVRTVSADVRVSNVAGVVTARSVSGDVDVSGSPQRVTAASTSGDINLAGISTGRIDANATSGTIEVSGTVRESLSAESVSGDVLISARAPDVRAQSVSGDVRLRGVDGRVSVGTVSGDAEIRDSRIQYGSFESVSGSLIYQGEIVPGASVDFESHSGDVELILPASTAAEFDTQTFSGEIRSDFGGDVRRTSRYAPGREMRLTTGRGGGLVTIETFSGTVKLTRR